MILSGLSPLEDDVDCHGGLHQQFEIKDVEVTSPLLSLLPEL